MRKRTSEKNCFCWTCSKDFHCLGISSHRAMHRRKKEACKITFTNGDTRVWDYALPRKPA